MNAREYSEWIEQSTLSKYAAKSYETKGREKAIQDCSIRTVYARDRDRIIHCKSFRRLKHKTQVFLAPQGDHYRTRLTHTLEVSQIARTISRALRLNEDLTEAIAMGHDLGHTPFGHSGEDVLDKLLPNGFTHNVQSLRVVEKLENNGEGLNLTFEVRDGILNHKKDGNPSTLEGKVVSFADRIAYINHDIDDSIRAGILKETDIPSSASNLLGHTHGQRIDSMITDVVFNSFDKPAIRMSDEVHEQFNILRDFMFERVYTDKTAKSEENKAKRVIEELFHYYRDNIEKLPKEFLLYLDTDGKDVITADYIACMTDNYAVQDYKKLFVPDAWI